MRKFGRRGERTNNFAAEANAALKRNNEFTITRVNSKVKHVDTSRLNLRITRVQMFRRGMFKIFINPR